MSAQDGRALTFSALAKSPSACDIGSFLTSAPASTDNRALFYHPFAVIALSTSTFCALKVISQDAASYYFISSFNCWWHASGAYVPVVPVTTTGQAKVPTRSRSMHQSIVFPAPRSFTPLSFEYFWERGAHSGYILSFSRCNRNRKTSK